MSERNDFFDIEHMPYENLEETEGLIDQADAAVCMTDEDCELINEYLDFLDDLLEHQEKFNEHKLTFHKLYYFDRYTAECARYLAMDEAATVSRLKQRLFVYLRSNILLSLLPMRMDEEDILDEENIGENIIDDEILIAKSHKSGEDSANIYCWRCGTKMISGGDFCIKCGANANVIEDSAAPKTKECKTSKTSLIAKLRNSIDPDKRNKIIKISIISVIALVVLVIIINAAVNGVRNAELRNFATETMSEKYTNVYADVISIEPMYFVLTSYNGSSMASAMISSVVCRCETVEGKYIWVVIDRGDYPGGGWNEDDFETLKYNKTSPMKLTGSVIKSGDIIEKLKDSIGDVFVLKVKDLNK